MSTSARFPDVANVKQLRAKVAERQHEHLKLATDDESIKSDNDLRAVWAAIGVLAYSDRVFSGSDEDFFTVLGDFMADFMHLCDALDVPLEEVLARAYHHYEPELVGEL